MRKRLFSILQYFLFLGGGIFLVWWQLKSFTGEQRTAFTDAFSHANYWLLIPVVISIILGNISRSMRWKSLMAPLGYNPSLKNVFAVTMIGFLANAAIPRLGELLKCTILSRYENLKVDKVVGTIIVERTFDFFCYLIIIGITVLIQIDLIGTYVKSKLKLIFQSSGIPVWGKLMIAVGIIVIVYYVIKLLIKKYPQSTLIFKINNFLNGIAEGFISIKKLKNRKVFLLHTIFIWGMFLLQIYIGFFAMEGTSHLGIKAGFSVLSIATLAMIATPGGIGSFPIFVKEVLFIYGISATLGIAFGWLMWGIFTGIVIIVGFLSLFFLPYMNKNKIKHEISSTDPSQNL